MPTILRFALAHAAIGFAAAAVFVGGFLLSDPNGAGTLLLTAAGHPWPAVLLWAFVGSTFAGAQIGIAVMRIGEAPPPARRDVGWEPAPALLKVRARRR